MTNIAIKMKCAGKLLLLFVVLTWLGCSKDKKTAAPVSAPDSKDTSGVVEDQPDNALGIPGAYFSDASKVRRLASATEIMDKLIACIDATPKGAVIHVNVYEFDYTPVMLALQRAYERGVQLQLMVDSSNETTWRTNQATVEHLRNFIRSPSNLVLVHNDISSNSTNHHKHVLFSALNEGGYSFKNVVFSTSANFTARELTVLEDAVVLSDPDLYAAFVANWQAMERHARSGMKDFTYRTFHSLDGATSAYFFPRRVNGALDGKYNIPEILDQLDEAGYSQDTLLIGMDRWSDGSVQLGIVDRLIRMTEQGAHVEVITRYEGGPGLGTALTAKLKALRQKGATVLFLPKPHIIHSKYMLIKGRWRGARHRVLINGTLNWANSATQYTNNVLLVLMDSPLFDQYLNNYQAIKKAYFP